MVTMGKFVFLLVSVSLLGFSACAPVTVTKIYSEEWTDPTTGKKITYTESITQVPEQRMPIHLKHAEIYE